MEGKGDPNKKYVIIGAGAYLSDMFDIIQANGGKVSKLYQNIPEVQRDRVLSLGERLALIGYPVDVFDSLETFTPEADSQFIIGFITPQKQGLIAELKEKYGIKIASLVHPHAYLGSNVHLGEGVTIGAGTVIAPNAFLDDFCVINRAVSVGHEARLGRCARLGPSVAVAAATEIGECTSVGIGATILDRLRIGAHSVIGAGAVVTKDIPDRVVAYGVPAKVVRENRDQER